jgi:hypothetical protein
MTYTDVLENVKQFVFNCFRYNKVAKSKRWRYFSTFQYLSKNFMQISFVAERYKCLHFSLEIVVWNSKRATNYWYTSFPLLLLSLNNQSTFYRYNNLRRISILFISWFIWQWESHVNIHTFYINFLLQILFSRFSKIRNICY